MIKIVTDSTCDLPQHYIDRYAIAIVPIVIRFGETSYLDGVNIDPSMFYSMIKERQALPQTSQPSPADFARVYRAVGATADHILSIHVTSKLSGTFHSAQMAAEMVKDEVAVTTFDSLGGSAGLGYMCIEAARMAEAGASIAEILNRLDHIRAEVNIFLTLADLRFAQMSGRVGRLQGTLAALLNVKPLIALRDGVIEVVEQVRTRQRVLNRMLALTTEQVGDSMVNLSVIHAQALQEAEKLFTRARETFHCQESYIHELGLGLAVNLGPGTLGIITYRV